MPSIRELQKKLETLSWDDPKFEAIVDQINALNQIAVPKNNNPKGHTNKQNQIKWKEEIPIEEKPIPKRQEYHKQWRKDHPNVDKIWYQKKKEADPEFLEKRRLKKKAWREANPDKIRAQRERHKLKKQSNTK